MPDGRDPVIVVVGVVMAVLALVIITVGTLSLARRRILARDRAGPIRRRTDRRAQVTASARGPSLRAALEQAHGENLDLRRELARRGGNQHLSDPG
jgi:hypothetical protein